MDLAIQDHRSGLGGRHLLTFVKRNRTLKLPWNRLRVGSPVVVTSLDDADASPQSGVVSARKVDSIQVAVDHWISGSRFDLDLSTDEVLRNRERARCKLLQRCAVAWASCGKSPWAISIRSMRSPGSPGLATSGRWPAPKASIRRNSRRLNSPCRPRTSRSFTARPAPARPRRWLRSFARPRSAAKRCWPVRRAIRRSTICSSGWWTADSRSCALGIRRVKDELRGHTVDALVEAHDNMRLVKDLLRQAEDLYRKADRYTCAKPARGAKQDMRREARQLKAEAAPIRAASDRPRARPRRRDLRHDVD